MLIWKTRCIICQKFYTTLVKIANCWQPMYICRQLLDTNRKHKKVKINLEVKFAIKSLARCVDHFKSMTAVAVHMTIAKWCSSTAEQKWYLMRCFWPKTDEIPEHVWILLHQYNTYNYASVRGSVSDSFNALHSQCTVHIPCLFWIRLPCILACKPTVIAMAKNIAKWNDPHISR